MASQRSREICLKARAFITGGVHSGFRYREPHPIYFQKAEGSKVFDADGKEYIDCLVNMGACILGHKHPKVVDAVRQELETGLTVGLESELSVEVAELLREMIPSAEAVKFSNTGTEAVMHAIQIARGYTGKGIIVKVEGCYNGWYDDVAVNYHPPATATRSHYPIPESAGLAPGLKDRVRIVPYNDIQALERLVRRECGIAALIIEPVMFNSGCVLPKPGYLKAIREVTIENEIVLIFDEVLTGFRLAPGGAQQYYNVKPDLSVFAKAIANGLPISAVVGVEDVMKVTEPKTGKVAYSGTYNANQLSLAAAKATLNELKDGKIQEKIHKAGKFIEDIFSRLAEEMDVAAQMPSIGGKFQPLFTKEDIVDYRSAATSDPNMYKVFYEQMLSEGILFGPFNLGHHGISAAHSPEDLNKIAKAFEKGLRAVSNMVHK